MIWMLFLLSLILFHGVLNAEEIYILDGKGIRVLFDPHHESFARELIQTYPVIRKELKRTLGWDLASPVSVRVVRDTGQVRQWAESPLTVAVALPRDNFILIHASRLKAHLFTLRNTFKHEVCHLLLHQHIPGDRLPRWLDEGIAQWVSDGAGDILVNHKRSVLNRVALWGRILSINSLRHGFPQDDQGLTLAYEESKDFVGHLVGTSGPEGVVKVLNEMKKGCRVEEAVSNTYGASLEELERRWHRSLQKRITWWTYLSYHIYDLLFVMAGLMAIYGFIRIMIKKRGRLKEEKETEEIGNT